MGVRFGEHLRALRVAAGLTQEELAERAGLTANGIGALERGSRSRPYPHTVRALAAALDLPPDARERLIAAGAGRGGPAATARPTGVLPVPVTPLLGRQAEADRLCGLLASDDVRLLTLTGPGGVGKSRLAVEVAAAAPRAAFVALAPLSEPALVPGAIASALGLPDEAGADAGSLVQFLRGDALLLLLDNFEHLLDAAPVVAELMGGCPALTVLVSSRAPLRLRGEREFPVRPLDLPAAGCIASPDVAAAPAVQLFVQRAQAVLPAFALTEGNAGDVAHLCRRLGGLPLALELVAVKIRAMAPADLLARLDFALTGSGARDLPERQRTMRATLDWSYRLLQPPERELFRRLSVFAGAFRLDAVEALAGPGQGGDRTLSLFGSLVEQSLVQASHDESGTRYRMLEPLRQYARELLHAHGETEAAQAAHLAHFRALAARAGVEYHGADQLRWLRRTEEEYDDLRAALRCALSSGEAAAAADMVWGLWPFWWVGGRHHEAAGWSEQTLLQDLAPCWRIRVLVVRGLMHYARQDFAAASGLWQEAERLARAEDDPAGTSYGLAGAALVAMATGRLAEARRLLGAALPPAEEAGEEWLVSLANIWLGGVLLLEGNARAAIPVFEAARERALRRQVRVVVNVATVNLAAAELSIGDYDRAEEFLLESVTLSSALRDANHLAYGLDALAVVAARRGEFVRAARLLGAAEAMRRTSDGLAYHWYPPEEKLRVRSTALAAAALGPEEFERAWDAGLQLTLDQAATEARRAPAV